jgi:hypothetical protein
VDLGESAGERLDRCFNKQRKRKFPTTSNDHFADFPHESGTRFDLAGLNTGSAISIGGKRKARASQPTAVNCTPMRLFTQST